MRFFYILILILALGIAAFFFFGIHDEMVVVYFYDETTENINSYQEIQFIESLSKPLQAEKTDLVFQSFYTGQRRGSTSRIAEINSRFKPDFVLMNLSEENTTFITDYYCKREFSGVSPVLLNISKECIKPDGDYCINLLPDPEKMAESMLKKGHFEENLLIVTGDRDRVYEESLVEALLRKNPDAAVLRLEETGDEQTDNAIETIIKEINKKKQSSQHPPEKRTDLLLLLETKKVVSILEKIVGYPRDRIFISDKAVGWESLYYGGTNIYGVRGFALTKPLSNVRIDQYTQYIKAQLESCSEAYLSYEYEYDERIKVLYDYLNHRGTLDIKLVEFSEDGFLNGLENVMNE